MARIIVVTSGKGGVGKTTTSAAFAMGLAERGLKTVVIDFDVGLRNLDLIMGCERRVVYDFVNVVNGEANVGQALIKDKRNPNLYILPASQTRDKEALTIEGVDMVLKELGREFEFIVCDSPAGIEKGATLAMYFADDAIVVTNPEVSSVRDSDRMIGILSSKSRRAEQGLEGIREYLLVSRYSPERVARQRLIVELLKADPDILQNDLDRILRSIDDAIEADFAMGNVRVLRNRSSSSFIAWSSQPGLGGPTWFVVDRNAEGFEKGKREDKHGIRASNTAALSLQDVRVGVDRIVGEEEGLGLVQAQAVFGYTRLMVAAFGLGAGAILWMASYFLGSDPLALAVTLVIGCVAV